MRCFGDIHCVHCRGLGDHVKQPDRPRGEHTVHLTRCRVCRGTGLI